MNLLPRVALVALALTVFAVPANAAYAYGSVVDKNDFDQIPVPKALDNQLCWIDDNGDSVVNLGEPVYVKYKTSTCGSIAVKDIRITPNGALAAGTQVKIKDADELKGTSLTAINGVGDNPAHAIRIADIDGDGKTKKADSYYIDLEPTTLAVDASDEVDVGDIRITAYGVYKAGTMVVEGDPDVGNKYKDLTGGTPALVDVDVSTSDEMTFGVTVVAGTGTTHIVYEAGKGIYLNVDRKGFTGASANSLEVGVEEGDVRLVNAVPNLPGDIFANIGNPGQVVDGLSFSKDVVAPGEVFQAYITVKNPTVKVGSALVKTSVDGVLVDARGTPTLAQNEVSTLVVSLFAPLTAGQHKVTAGETTAFFDVEGSVAASSASLHADGEASVAKAEKAKQGAPSLALLGTLVALGVAVLRRRAD